MFDPCIAVATAAQALGVACEVFLPDVSSQAKRTALAALGARVAVDGAAYPDALAVCMTRQRGSGALLMHAYDQAEVVAGAGTLGAEIEAEAGLSERLLVSVGEGGLVAGVAAGFGGGCRIGALEPAAALPLGALWTGLVQPAAYERVAVIVCGANLDPASLA